MCLKIYTHHRYRFFSAPRLAWQATLKNKNVKLELLIDIDMLLTVEKGIRGGICHSSCRYVKANSKYMKDYDKNKESSYLFYCDVNNFYTWVMWQKLLILIINGLKIYNSFMQKCSEYSDIGYFLVVYVQYPKIIWTSKWFTIFTRKNENWKSLNSCINLHDKKEYVVHTITLKQALNNELVL